MDGRDFNSMEDKPTVSAHLPVEIATMVVETAGWRRDERGAWVHPDVDPFLWELDEVLTITICASVA